MDGGIGFLVFMGVVLAVVGILYYKAKRPKKVLVPQPEPKPVPQGPRPPEGLPEGPQGPLRGCLRDLPMVSGWMRVESQEVQNLIRENLGPDDLRSLSESFAKKGRANPDWERCTPSLATSSEQIGGSGKPWSETPRWIATS
jgi:hypothetical protein